MAQLSVFETGSPSEDPGGFRRCLGAFGTGVTVITTQVDGKPYGVTCNSFSSVSLEPPLVLWCLRRESTSFDAFKSCANFAVNILAESQVDLSNRFAKSGHDKFEGVDWQSGLNGSPLLAGTAAALACRSFRTFEGGDHLIILGEVQTFENHPRQPLMFTNGCYTVAVEHPDTRAYPSADMLESSDGLDHQVLSLLLVRAYSTVAARLEAGRRTAKLGLSLMQARVLKAVQMFPDRTLEQLLPELLLDAQGALLALNAVEQMNLVGQDDMGRIRLTSAGEARLYSLMEHTRASEAHIFRDIPVEDMATVHRVLTRIIEQGGLGE